MGFLHLFIVNKSGGLIHHRALGPRAPSIGTNDWLRIGSTFHSLHAIASEASPVKASGVDSLDSNEGIETIEASGLHLSCLETRTGVKFVITSEPDVPSDAYSTANASTRGNHNHDDIDDPKRVLRELYVLYAECALKDPFYELDMPIRCELFGDAVDALMGRLRGGGGGSKVGGSRNR